MNRGEVIASINRTGGPRVLTWCHWYAKETEQEYGADLEAIVNRYPDDVAVVTRRSRKSQR